MKKARAKKSKNKGVHRGWVAAFVFLAVAGYAYMYQQKQINNYVADTWIDITGLTEPEVVTINAIAAGRQLPLSDDPDVNAMTAAHHYIREAVKNGKDQNDVEVKKNAEIVAAQAALKTAQNPQARAAMKTDDPLRITNTSASFDTIKIAAVRALETLQSYVSYQNKAGKVEQKIRNITYVCVDENNNVAEPDQEKDINQQCPDGYRRTISSYTRIYSNLSDRSDDFERRFCNIEDTHYPVGISLPLDQESCRVCVRKTGQSGAVTTDMVSVNINDKACTAKPMGVDPESGLSSNCKIYYSPNDGAYTLSTDIKGAKEVLFPSDGQSVFLKRAEIHNRVEEMRCINGEWE